MDLEAQARWYDYSRARDAMFAATDTPESPWYSRMKVAMKRNAPNKEKPISMSPMPLPNTC
jgi:polyphosphate kinase 2 (PPK2 family)